MTKNFDLSNHIFSKEITKKTLIFFEKSEVNELLLENERFRGFRDFFKFDFGDYESVLDSFLKEEDEGQRYFSPYNRLYREDVIVWSLSV